MTTANAQTNNANNTNYSYATVPTKFVEANGIKFAYRSYGKTGDLPVIYFNHLTANLDNCDPRIMDAIAAHRQIISFDYRGVGATTGKQGESIADMAKDGIAFIHALGYKQVDILAFSMGGFITQEMGREINTMGSKSNHAEMQKLVVMMKDELEKIKEQVLNVL